MHPTPRLVITPGEPAGIGPEILLQLAGESFPAELIAIADQNLLAARAEKLPLNIKFIPADFSLPASQHQPGTLKILHTPLQTISQPGQLNPKNAKYVLQCLEKATELCLQKKADALVTGPVHKGVLNDAGIKFSGHTEFLAEKCGVKKAVMLFVVDQLKVALVTTHVPLAQVSHAITQNVLTETIAILHRELQLKFAITEPRIAVCGLNPHAGESGHLGREEIDVIVPVLELLRKSDMHLSGPWPADTIFTAKHLRETDAVLAMYHDQALPLVKYLGFDRAVNVTLGLPIIRTSVDHGTALDIAGTGKADAGSLREAVRLAIELAKL